MSLSSSLLFGGEYHPKVFIPSETEPTCPFNVRKTVPSQVDQLTEQLRQHRAGGSSGLLQRLVDAQASGPGSPGGNLGQRDLKLELDELRTAFTEQVKDIGEDALFVAPTP